jgi:phosphatidylinositol 4-kinase
MHGSVRDGKVPGGLHQGQETSAKACCSARSGAIADWLSALQTADGDDLVSSTMYSLLNYVTSTPNHLSAQGAGYAASSRSGDGRAAKAPDAMTVHTMAGTVFGGGRTDEARRQVNGSAIAVVTRLALEFNRPEVTHITVSMLLQRLRGADAHTEAIIVTNLVHLALIAPRADFIDIIKSFSLVSAAPNPEEPRHSSAAVLAAQTRLGRELKGKTDLRDAFLTETLQLFADKGTNVQMLAVAHSGGSTASPLGVDLGRSSSKGMGKRQSEELVKDLTGQLAGLLLPLDAILNHRNFNPHHDPSPALVALFRNMWFICVVLGIPGTLTDWHVAALDRIALKTPALILESASDYVSSDLEYNSILRKEFSDVVLSKRRSALSALIPALAADIRSLSLPQVTLLQTIFEVENRRSKLGRPSYLLAYFSNDSLNESELAKPLGAIATKIIANFRDEVWRLSLSHRLDPHLSIELQRLLVGCTHRFKKVRDVSFAYLSQLLGTFPSLMCSADMVFALLEVLTIMRNSCEEEYTDEYSPIYEHRSEKIDLRLELSDSFTVRNEITTQLYGYARTWLTSAISRAPIEVQTILQVRRPTDGPSWP